MIFELVEMERWSQAIRNRSSIRSMSIMMMHPEFERRGSDIDYQDPVRLRIELRIGVEWAIITDGCP